MAGIRDYKPDKNKISRFLTLALDSDKINKNVIGAWRRVIGGKKGLALNLYKELLHSKRGEFTEELSEKLNEPIHNIRRALNDLKIIGLIEKLPRKKQHRVISDFWRIEKRVDGLLRLIPLDEDKPSLEGKEEFWFKKYEALSSLFTKYTGYTWILKKHIDWKIQKDGLMDYNEKRNYLKLSNITPPINYITLFSKSDNYNLQILDQNRKSLEISTEIYEHQNKKLNIVNALIPHDNFKNIFQKLHVGESYFIEITDQKRLYACPKTKKTYMACFLYQINLENIDTLEINYQIHKNIHPISCGIWYDNHKELEVNLRSEKSGQQENINFKVSNEKNYVNFNWKGSYLLNKAHVLKLLFEFEPEFESDLKSWIKMYSAVDCPFCHKIPFETIGRI
ncbi:MAG: hypothetical protein HWN67_04690 [Candidatus Helarchaeota archaeon]|nr:hypothetical protein [Candidatus Helarchaeota archaeon]